MTVSVLVSRVDHFTVEAISGRLHSLQYLVDGFIENIPVPRGDGGVHGYINEEGKLHGLPVNRVSTRFIDHLYGMAGDRLFSSYDVLVGPCVWLGSTANGGEASLPLELIRMFSQVQRGSWDAESPVTVLRHHNDVWVFDTNDNQLTLELQACVRTARSALSSGGDHGIIEVWPDVDKNRWTEIRVDIMDDYRITLHDKRNDRSYG